MPAADETDSRRIVCFCFGHSEAALLAATREDGSNRIEDEIRDACRRGLDRCATTNPAGRCCLGAVRKLVRAQSAGVADEPGCCGEDA